MASLPPKPGDTLPPRPSRGGTSPRAASMRDDPRERDREERRRRSPDSRRFTSPRHDVWRRPTRDEDRYQDYHSRSTREREERERRPRSSRSDRGAMDTYRPDSHGSLRRRSSPIHDRRRLSHSGSRSPRAAHRSAQTPSPTQYHKQQSTPKTRSPSSRKRYSRSQSPHRRDTSPRTREVSPRKHERSRSPRRSPHPNRKSVPQRGGDNHDDHVSPSNSKATSETQNEPSEHAADHDVSRESPLPSAELLAENESMIHKTEKEKSVPKGGTPKEKAPVAVRTLPTHPTPSGPRRPRTPTGPRTRSPVQNRIDRPDDPTLRREEKGKDKEIYQEQSQVGTVRRHDSSLSPPRGPRKRTRRSRSRSRSRSTPRSSQSPSLSSRSRSRSRSRSHQTASERAGSVTSRKDLGDKYRIDELIPPLPPRESWTATQDAEIKRIQAQRAKLEGEHASTTRAVRRAQHELDLAAMELRSAEERRKAAQRVHERAVKGFLTIVT